MIYGWHCKNRKNDSETVSKETLKINSKSKTETSNNFSSPDSKESNLLDKVWERVWDLYEQRNRFWDKFKDDSLGISSPALPFSPLKGHDLCPNSKGDATKNVKMIPKPSLRNPWKSNSSPRPRQVQDLRLGQILHSSQFRKYTFLFCCVPPSNPLILVSLYLLNYKETKTISGVAARQRSQDTIKSRGLDWNALVPKLGGPLGPSLPPPWVLQKWVKIIHHFL